MPRNRSKGCAHIGCLSLVVGVGRRIGADTPNIKLLLELLNDLFCKRDPMRYLTRQEAFRLQHQATGRERLRALAEFVEALPADRLTLGFWFKSGRGWAVGLAAAIDPWFQAQGLRLDEIDRPALCHPVCQQKSDWNAVAAFLDLNLKQCRGLFTAAAYAGNLRPLPHLVSEKIAQHLAADRSTDRPGGNFIRFSAPV